MTTYFPGKYLKLDGNVISLDERACRILESLDHTDEEQAAVNECEQQEPTDARVRRHPHWSGFDIGQAVMYLRMGRRVRRTGWNGKNMYLKLHVPDFDSKMDRPFVYIKPPAGADGWETGGFVPWVCSQTDLLATDWEVVTD